MRIAFVSGNRETMPDAVIPLGLLYVMAATPDHHHKVHWDLCFEPEPLGALRDQLLAFDPEIVALGMRNIQNNTYSGTATNLQYYADIIATIRQHSRARIVLGGGGFSVMPGALTAHLQPDFAISGEGEAAFAALLAILEAGGEDFSPVPNLWRPLTGQNGHIEVVHTQPAPGWQDLDALAVPDRRLVDPRHYQRYRTDSVQTKRGCALQCDYCTYPTIEGRAVRRRNPVLVVDELFLSLERQPELRHVFVVDSVFNLPASHAKAVCRELIARNWQVPWTAYANPIGFDAELAELMVAAHCAGLEIGADSGVPAVLKRIKKGFTVGQIEEIHRICRAAGLRDCMTFILGTPGETLDDVRQTLDFCTQLEPFAAILMAWVDDEEALDAALAAQRRGFRDAVLALMRSKSADFPRWIMPPLEINFDDYLFGLLRGTGISGPLWQVIDLAGTDSRSRRLRRHGPTGSP